MPLQTNRLVMIGLGVLGDAPPNSLQPRLADGVHLRWAFPRSLGFPWYRFYLFRRPVRQRERICVIRTLQGFEAGTTAASPLNMPYGVFTSDSPLRFVDEFPAAGVELDLAGRR